ncbi:MAG: hypothetical protein NVSMB9_33520 [Isosphaeraceae bacterium]
MSLVRRWSLLICGLSILAGCSQSGPLLSRRTSVGTLKAGVSHLEFENQQLRRELAALKLENRKIEDRLVQEESVNGDLTARLDDARSLLRTRGLASNEETNPNRLETLGPEPRNTVRAGRSNRKRRKPPFARIPGRIDELPFSDASDDPGPRWNLPDEKTLDELDPQASLGRPSYWLPVAQGVTESGPSRR